MKNWEKIEFESSSSTTEEFKEFAKDYRKMVAGNLPDGFYIAKWNRGHFYVSCFIEHDNKFFYLSCSDVRYFPNEWKDNILVRTAKGLEDYTGGSNHYTNLLGIYDTLLRLEVATL